MSFFVITRRFKYCGLDKQRVECGLDRNEGEERRLRKIETKTKKNIQGREKKYKRDGCGTYMQGSLSCKSILVTSEIFIPW